MESKNKPTVSTFNDAALKAALKCAPKIIQEYVDAQRLAINGYQRICQDAIVKVKSISSTHVSEEKAVEAFCKICQEDNDGCPSEENLASEINCCSMKQFLAALKSENKDKI